MRHLIFAIVLAFGALSAGTAMSLSAVQCESIRDVYGWAPQQCDEQGTTPVLAAPRASDAAVRTGEPTAAQLESHIFFPNGGVALDPQAREQIDLLAQFLNGPVLGEACIALVGHSDTSGAEATNLRVAQARADAVQNAFRDRLRMPAKIEKTLAVGEAFPLENLSPQSRWQRRVEIRARPCGTDMQ